MSACRVCARSDFEEVLNTPDLRFAPRGARYRIVRCRGCRGMATWEEAGGPPAHPRYPSEYGAFGARAPAALALAGQRRGRSRLFPHVALHRFAWADELPGAPARVLEVGCAAGKVALALAQARNLDVQGIEPDPVAAQAARDAGLATHTGTLDDYPSDGARFDAVLFVHVLEHLPDPLAALRRARELLGAGGVVVVALPNVESLERRLFRASWDGWDLPRHLHHLGPKALCELLRRAGFVPGPVRHERYALLARSAGNRWRAHQRYAERRQAFRALGWLEPAWGYVVAALRSSSAIQLVARVDPAADD